ncbi:Hsp70 family protein [Dethiosulfovibrio salsuginis]|uniref:Hsp70 protein n=1 Tax=Dethiosulfovibrio salsuginis TaxID=561720 RepID=A0A1X7JQ85_9BACT|nr:Hsp70 family protein [Dethiosulfovibrio salsuginis]SMG30460.1 Hsp70 protein [Dethiosulfovibrio salsuginis]
MNHFFAIDIGSKKLAAYYTCSPQSLSQNTDEEIEYLKIYACEKNSQQKNLQQGKVSFPCAKGGLKSFLGGKDLVKASNGALSADAIIVAFLGEIRVDLEKACLNGRTMSESSVIAESVTTIGYPFGWNEIQKNTYIKAVEQAGFPNVRIIDESSALVAYLKKLNSETSLGQGKILIYDLGSASMNIAVAELDAEGNPKQLAATGNPSCGGNKLDEQINLLVDKKLNDFLSKGDFKGNLPSEEETAAFSTRLKERLSVAVTNGTPEIEENFGIEDQNVLISLSRSEIDALFEDIMPQIMEPVWEALSKAFLQPEDIGTILFAGGAAQLWCVREKIESIFSQAKILWSENPQETMVKGLALHSITKEMAQQHLVTEPKEQKKEIFSEKKAHRPSPSDRPSSSRGIFKTAFIVATLVIVGWFLSDRFNILGTRQSQNEFIAQNNETTQIDRNISSDDSTETSAKAQKEGLLPQISNPKNTKIICALEEESDNSDFLQGILFAKEQLDIISVESWQLNKTVATEKNDSYDFKIVIGSKENLETSKTEIASGDKQIGFTYVPLWKDSSDIVSPQLNAQDIMKIAGSDSVLIRRLANSEVSTDVTLSPSKTSGWSPFGGSDQNDTTEIKIIDLARTGSLKIVFLDTSPKNVYKNNSYDPKNPPIIIPPLDWHRGFWSVVLLIKQGLLGEDNTIENLSALLNTTITVVTKDEVLLYKRDKDNQDIQEIERFPLKN